MRRRTVSKDPKRLSADLLRPQESPRSHLSLRTNGQFNFVHGPVDFVPFLFTVFTVTPSHPPRIGTFPSFDLDRNSGGSPHWNRFRKTKRPGTKVGDILRLQPCTLDISREVDTPSHHFINETRPAKYLYQRRPETSLGQSITSCLTTSLNVIF